MTSQSKVENLPEAEHERWHRFIDAMNAAVDSVWPDDESKPVLVVGAQWGGMGSSAHPDLPTCLVTSNLPECLVPAAVADVLTAAEAVHTDYHGFDPHAETTVREKVSIDSVPEEVREAAVKWAEALGFKEADVQFIQVADASDLADLPLFGGNDDEHPHERGEN